MLPWRSFADGRTRKEKRLLRPLNLSNNVPVLYGMASIVLALVFGVGAAIIRRQLSNLKKKYPVKWF